MLCDSPFAFMGLAGGFCYFHFCWVVHGPSAGNLLQYCLRAPALGSCYSLNYVHSEASSGECVTFGLLRNFCHSLFFYCYFVCDSNLFVTLIKLVI